MHPKRLRRTSPDIHINCNLHSSGGAYGGGTGCKLQGTEFESNGVGWCEEFGQCGRRASGEWRGEGRERSEEGGGSDDARCHCGIGFVVFTGFFQVRIEFESQDIVLFCSSSCPLPLFLSYPPLSQLVFFSPQIPTSPPFRTACNHTFTTFSMPHYATPCI